MHREQKQYNFDFSIYHSLMVICATADSRQLSGLCSFSQIDPSSLFKSKHLRTTTALRNCTHCPLFDTLKDPILFLPKLAMINIRRRDNFSKKFPPEIILWGDYCGSMFAKFSLAKWTVAELRCTGFPNSEEAKYFIWVARSLFHAANSLTA